MSPQIIKKDLEATTNPPKVGRGQMLYDAESQNPLLVMPGKKPKRVIRYGMKVELDENFMLTKDLLDKQKLFFHEVGHGLEMDHSPEADTANVSSRLLRLFGASALPLFGRVPF